MKTNKYKLGLLITDKYNINIVDLIFKTNLPIYYLKPDFLAIKKTMLTKKYYKHFKDHYNIFIWTIKTEKEMVMLKYLMHVNTMDVKHIQHYAFLV